MRLSDLGFSERLSDPHLVRQVLPAANEQLNIPKVMPSSQDQNHFKEL